MAYTYSKIATYTVGSGGISSINFLNIPQTYTDLKLVISGRSSGGSGGVMINFNSDSNGSNYSQRRIQANGSTVASYGTYAQVCGFVSISTDTANTFGNSSVYMPNYTGSNYKSYSADGLSENNGTTAYIELGAGLWSSTSPITSIRIFVDSSQNFAQYSTAHLYGIKAEL
jgi:hypothetical protein